MKHVSLKALALLAVMTVFLGACRNKPAEESSTAPPQTKASGTQSFHTDSTAKAVTVQSSGTAVSAATQPDSLETTVESGETTEDWVVSPPWEAGDLRSEDE